MSRLYLPPRSPSHSVPKSYAFSQLRLQRLTHRGLHKPSGALETPSRELYYVLSNNPLLRSGPCFSLLSLSHGRTRSPPYISRISGIPAVLLRPRAQCEAQTCAFVMGNTFAFSPPRSRTCSDPEPMRLLLRFVDGRTALRSRRRLDDSGD